MKILLRPNFNKSLSKETTINVIKHINTIGLEPLITKDDYANLDGLAGITTGSLDELLQQSNLIMPIGGDGTVLNQVGNAINYDLPILGVNTGRIGFLTQLETHELDKLSLLISGDYEISQRMLLQAEIKRKEESSFFYALNDVVFKRIGNDPSLLDISIYKENSLILRHRADGVIFSTATGSTAYNLSAGGPAIMPTMEAISVTAICPYNTFRSSLILPSDGEYWVVEEHQNAPWSFSIAIDGSWSQEVAKGEGAIIRRHHQKLKLIDLGIRNFYDKLNHKHSRQF